MHLVIFVAINCCASLIERLVNEETAKRLQKAHLYFSTSHIHPADVCCNCLVESCVDLLRCESYRSVLGV